MTGKGSNVQRKVMESDRISKGKAMKPTPNSLFADTSKRAQALAAWPLYGGTTPGGPAPTTDPATTPPAATPPATTTTDSKTKATPAAPEVDVNQLVSQLSTLQQQLETVQTENQTFKDEQTKAEQAKLSKEEQLQTTIQQKDAIIEAAQRLLAQKSLENALLTHKDYQWHDSADAMNNLRDHPDVKVTVDIEKQIASVEGLDKAVKDLATRKPWMLSQGPADPATTPQQQSAPPVTARPTGTPPAPPNQTQVDKTTRRKAMGGKYTALRGAPVIAGR